MMESEILQPNWAIYNLDQSELFNFSMDESDPCDFSSSFLSGDSFDSYLVETLAELPSFCDEKVSIADMWIEDGSDAVSQLTTESDQWTPQSVTLPSMEMDSDQVRLNHLLTAYGEAVENGLEDLSDVIVGRIREKIDPLGEPQERVAFSLFQSKDSQGSYLKQQSSRNWDQAFQTFYQWYPYGRFAHFTANSAILQAMPCDALSIRIVDFDVGEGVQWPPLIEAMSRAGRSLRITSVKFSGEEDDPVWRFDDTRRRLCHLASSLGMHLEIEEMELGDLAMEIKNSARRDWLGFNLMSALPHMGRQRERANVDEFLKVAKGLVPFSNSKGVIVFGDGVGDYSSASCMDYTSFFSDRFRHFEALFESMECDFPDHLQEARIAMESLFVSPYVSSRSWLVQWRGARESARDGGAVRGMEGCRMSRESLMEARQIVNQRESCYQVFYQDGRENEMVLGWKGIPLVRVSCWR